MAFVVKPDALTGTEPPEYVAAWNVIYGSGSISTPPVDTSVITDVSESGFLGTSDDVNYTYSATGTITLTLPAADSRLNFYTVKNVGTGIVTLTSPSTIDGDPTFPIYPQESVTVGQVAGNWSMF